jgi:hypothetical protein
VESVENRKAGFPLPHALRFAFLPFKNFWPLTRPEGDILIEA